MQRDRKVKFIVLFVLLGVLITGCSAHDSSSKEQYKIKTTTEGKGKIAKEPSGPYSPNTKVTLTAKPAEGWKFSNWVGNLDGEEPKQIITVTDNMTVKAQFIDVPTINNLKIERKNMEVTLSCSVKESNGEVNQVKIKWGDESDPALIEKGFKEISRSHTYEAKEEYTIKVIAVNEAGNKRIEEKKIKIDNSTPEIEITSKTIDKNKLVLKTNMTDPDGSISGVKVNWGDGDIEEWSSGVSEISHNYREGGKYEVEITVTDNNEESSSKQLEAVIKTPVINIEDTTVNNREVTFTGSVTDKNNNLSEVKIDWGDGENTIVSSNFGDISRRHTYATGGNYEITITAESADGEISEEKIKIGIGTPKITIKNAAVNNKTVNLEVDVVSNTSSIAKVIIDWGEETEEITSGFKDISTSYTYDVGGPKEIKIIARDEEGKESVKTTNIAIDRPPEITSISNVDNGKVTVAEGEKLTLEVESIDPDGDEVSLSANNMPEGANFKTGSDRSTGKFIWTPEYDQQGKSYDVTFVAEAKGKGVARTVTIEIKNTDRDPQIKTIKDKTIKVGKKLNFTVEASDPDGDKVNLSLNNVPEGASFDSETGEFSWKPATNQLGEHEIVFTAEANGKLDKEGVKIDVEDRKFDIKVKTGSKFKGEYRVKLYKLSENTSEIEFYTKTMGGFGDDEIRLKPITENKSEQICTNGEILKVSNVNYQSQYVFDYDVGNDFSGGGDDVTLPSDVSLSFVESKTFNDSEDSTAEITFNDLSYGKYYIKVDKKVTLTEEMKINLNVSEGTSEWDRYYCYKISGTSVYLKKLEVSSSMGITIGFDDKDGSVASTHGSGPGVWEINEAAKPPIYFKYKQARDSGEFDAKLYYDYTTWK